MLIPLKRAIKWRREIFAVGILCVACGDPLFYWILVPAFAGINLRGNDEEDEGMPEIAGVRVKSPPILPAVKFLKILL